MKQKTIINTILTLAFLLSSYISFSQEANFSDLKRKYISGFRKTFSRWIKSNENFDLKNFRLCKSQAFENIKFKAFSELPGFLRIYKKINYYSYDSSKFLDLFSYELNLKLRKGKLVYEGSEADQAISFCDLNQKTWNRIFFCGGNLRIDDALWVSNNKFILVGNLHENTIQPFILVGDIQRRQLFQYKSTNQKCIQKQGYSSIKLKRVKINN